MSERRFPWDDDSQAVRQQRLERRLQRAAERRMLPLQRSLDLYGNVAVAAVPGVSEEAFVADLKQYFARKDPDRTIVEWKAEGIVQGNSISGREATSRLSGLGYATRRGHSALLLLRHLDLTGRRSGAKESVGHPALWEGLRRLVAVEQLSEGRSPEPKVVATGSIDHRPAHGVVYRPLPEEDFSRFFAAHLALWPEGTLRPYVIDPSRGDPDAPSEPGPAKPGSIKIVYGSTQVDEPWAHKPWQDS